MRRVVSPEAENPNPSTSGFLNKLRHLVNSPETDHLIAWSPSGDSFHVFDGPKLAQKVLPIYFKHNNLSSFVRQLNMYGFRKVNRPETGLARMNSNDLQFTHPSFIRDMPHLMKNIQRRNNISGHRNGTSTELVPNTSLDLYRRDDDEEISRRDFRRMLDTINEMKQVQHSTDCKVNVLRQENELLLKKVECLVETCQRNSVVIQQLMNMFMPIIGNGEQRVHNLLGPVKRQITASGEEGSSAGPSFRSLEDLKLHIMNSAGHQLPDTSLDGPRPAKLRRGIVRGQAGGGGGSLASSGAGSSYQASDNSGLVIEEVRDDTPVRKLIPATTAAAKRPLRIIMPSAVKGKTSNNGTAWTTTTDLGGSPNGAHNVIMPELGFPLFPQLDNQVDKRSVGQELVPSHGQQQLLRTPSISFNLPEKIEDLLNNLPDVDSNEQVQSVPDVQPTTGEHIVGNELIPANILNDDMVYNSVRNVATNPDIDDMLAFDEQLSGNEDSNITPPDSDGLVDIFGDSNEGLDSQSPGLISPLPLTSPVTGNGSSSPPLLAPSAPKYSSVNIVAPERANDFDFPIQ